MSALHSLGLDGAFGNPSILGDGVSLHQWVINIIKENNLTSNSVTNGLLHDLLARLVMKHHRHAQHDPKRQLTKAHIAHIVGFMICRMGLEEVTPKVVRTVWNYMPKEEPPDALWTGIDYIKKHAARGRAAITGVEGVAADGRRDDNVGGAGGGGGEGSLGGGAGDSGGHVADAGDLGGGEEAVVTGGEGDGAARWDQGGEAGKAGGTSFCFSSI